MGLAMSNSVMLKEHAAMSNDRISAGKMSFACPHIERFIKLFVYFR